MLDYVRALDLDTGHKNTVLRSELAHGNYRELDEPATNLNGDPLPGELAVTAKTAEQLKGTELEQALKDADLSTTGSADDKRARLAEHAATQTPAPSTEGQTATDQNEENS